MENTNPTSNASCDQAMFLVTKAYQDYYSSILSYITYKTNSQFDAEDLTQDVFVRLLGYKQMLREETIKSFTYTIARNIVIDYVRRHTRKVEITANMLEFMPTYTNDVENKMYERELLKLEASNLKKFSPQRKLVYSLCRYDDMSVPEISDKLNLSKRTVENHLFVARRQMRDFIRKCV